MNLKDIIVKVKTAKVEFPGLEGFEIEVAAISRELSRKIKEESEVSKIDPKLKMPIQTLDEELFLSKFCDAAIKGWKGLKLKYLQDLVLVDLSGQDLESELEYNKENARDLIKNSQVFDTWLNEQVFSLDTFRD